MLFNSIDFLLFFPIVVLAYMVIPKKLRCLWLLISSYYFYMNWNPKYAILILISTVLTYLTAIGIEVFRNNNCLSGTRICVVLCCLINIGILVFFKYFDFIIENINCILTVFNIRLINKPFDLLLPVGISFYTFQALGYMIDVYRCKIPAEKNIIRYALFVSFFPQLVAGPIERSYNLLTQIIDLPQKRLVNYKRIVDGLFYMLWGYFLKLVIADRASLLVDYVFDKHYLCGSIELMIGAIMFAIQIYCDFSSYSIIAIGAAHVMGISLMENFDAPYMALSIKDFWRRWHISLSGWFRDYVYISLGGNRCSRPKKYLNIMVTFLASGLWHGANWTYVFWGGMHGLYQILEDSLSNLKKKIYPYLGIKMDSICYHIGQVITTFILVDIAWIFFRAKSIGDAFIYITSMFTRWDPWVLFDGTLYTIGLTHYEWNVLLISLIILFLVDLIKIVKKERIDEFFDKQGLLAKCIFVYFLVMMIGIYGQYGGGFNEKVFIYFQF